VWEGRRREAPPYPDQSAAIEIAADARPNIGTFLSGHEGGQSERRLDPRSGAHGGQEGELVTQM